MEANDGKLFCGVVGGEARFSPQGSDFVEIDVLAGLCHGVVGADGVAISERDGPREIFGIESAVCLNHRFFKALFHSDCFGQIETLDKEVTFADCLCLFSSAITDTILYPKPVGQSTVSHGLSDVIS